jgi:hypothetical protein
MPFKKDGKKMARTVPHNPKKKPAGQSGLFFSGATGTRKRREVGIIHGLAVLDKLGERSCHNPRRNLSQLNAIP